MMQKEIEIDGEMKKAQIFDSMWEYLDHYGASVEDYVLSPEENVGEKIVRSFQPIEDVNFGTFSSDMIEIAGEYYQRVNWGEEEISFIPEASLNAEFWTIYERNERISGYSCQGGIFQTEEEAKANL